MAAFQATVADRDFNGEAMVGAHAATLDPLEEYFDAFTSELGDTATFESRAPGLRRSAFKEVAFSTLEKVLKACKAATKTSSGVDVETLITAEKCHIVVIVKASVSKPETQLSGKKHSLDDKTSNVNDNPADLVVSSAQDSKMDTILDDKVVELVGRLGKSSHHNKTSVDAAELLLRSAGRLKGASGERALQSFSAAYKKLGSQPHALVIAVSFNSGVCMRLASLKRCLGRSWNDGQLAIGKLDSFEDMTPPLSEEGNAALKFGNHPLMLLTSVG